ncbi:MAG: TetR/AcrR family transcriptional regulator [Thermoanaerobacteraceae bacterium]|nr:TetR/AcrR family transcriptional regulator [Thermoanaerobacteraceae bacterium]
MQGSSNRNGKQSEIRQRIIKTAQRLFVEQGYHRTSIPDIVREAGVSTGAIYHHFTNKKELAREIHQLALTEFLKRFKNHVESQPTFKEKLRAFVEMMFSWTETDPIMVQYLMYARPKEVVNTQMAICSEEGLDAVMCIIQAGIESGEIKEGNLYVHYGTLTGTVLRLIEIRMDGVIDFPLTEIIDETTANIWLALKK